MIVASWPAKASIPSKRSHLTVRSLLSNRLIHAKQSGPCLVPFGGTDFGWESGNEFIRGKDCVPLQTTWCSTSKTHGFPWFDMICMNRRVASWEWWSQKRSTKGYQRCLHLVTVTTLDRKRPWQSCVWLCLEVSTFKTNPTWPSKSMGKQTILKHALETMTLPTYVPTHLPTLERSWTFRS